MKPAGSLLSIWQDQQQGGFFVRHAAWSRDTRFLVCALKVDEYGQPSFAGRFFSEGRSWPEHLDNESPEDLGSGWYFTGLSRLRKAGLWDPNWAANRASGRPQAASPVGASAGVSAAVANRSRRC